MSTTETSNKPLVHTINFKLPDGNWIPIPIVAQGMYAAYQSKCQELGVPILKTEDEYLHALVTLVDIVNAYTPDVNTEHPVISIYNGGTGVGGFDADGNSRPEGEVKANIRFNLEVFSIDEVNALIGAALADAIGLANTALTNIRMLEQRVLELETQLATISPENVGITHGDNAPTDSTAGTIYFEY